MEGILLVLTGPSGGGKDVVMKELVEKYGWGRVVSCTTRRPRDREVDGLDYKFLTREDFERKKRAGEFVETNEYGGQRYGTEKSEIRRLLEGEKIVWRINPGAAVEARERIQNGLGPEGQELLPRVVVVYLIPESWEHLERAVVSRGEGVQVEEYRRERWREDMEVWKKFSDRFDIKVRNWWGKLPEVVAEVVERVEEWERG